MSVSMRTVFEQLGFSPDWQAITDRKPAYKYDFGNMMLGAAEMTGRSFRTVFAVGGTCNDGRTLTLVEFELPVSVESFEQGVAWIVEGLGPDFCPTTQIEWLEKGRSWRDRLPWVLTEKAYEARPQCAVARDWFKLASKNLRGSLEASRPNEVATVSFDGQVLKIATENAIVAMPAEGIAWTENFAVATTDFRYLPRRLMSKMIEISVWEGALYLGGHTLRLINQSREGRDTSPSTGGAH